MAFFKRARDPGRAGCLTFLLIMGLFVVFVAIVMLMMPNLNPDLGASPKLVLGIASILDFILRWGFWAAAGAGLLVYFWRRSQTKK